MGSSHNLPGISILVSFEFIIKYNCARRYTARQGKTLGQGNKVPMQ